MAPQPTEELVLDAWDSLREHWLAHDPAPLAAVVTDLWQPGQGNSYLRPSTAGQQIEWLRRRNNTRLPGGGEAVIWCRQPASGGAPLTV
jgi:hypothetical protein